MKKLLHSSIMYFAVVSSICITLGDGRTETKKDEVPDYYKVLNVSNDASTDEIKKAFRQLARKYHPDKCKEEDAVQKFEKIAEANEILSDPVKRKEYDMWRKRGGPFMGFQPSGSHQYHTFNFDDLFSAFDDFGDDHKPFGGSHFKVFDDFPDFFDSDPIPNRRGGNNHRFGSGSSYFNEQSGGARQYSAEPRQRSSGRSCRTVTQRVGNTITQYTTCT